MIDRRNLLRGALLGAGMTAFSGRVLASASRALEIAGPRSAGDQLLFVFLRGGNDGVNTLIPQLDPTYQAARPTLKITNGIALPGVSYSRLNPDLQRLVGIDQLGNLALIHQAGDPSASRSHFTAQDMFEKGLSPSPPPTQSELAAASGFVPRMLAAAGVPAWDSSQLPAAVSISGLMQTMFRAGKSTQVSAHVRDLAKAGVPPLMTQVGVKTASLLHGADHYNDPTSLHDEQLGYELAFGHGTTDALIALGFTPGFATSGRFPLSGGELTQAATATGSTVVPTFDGSGAGFMRAAEQAVFTLVNSPSTRVLGVEYGGFDTHADQATDHPNLMRYLGWALRDMHDEILANNLGDRITILVVSEFGRTAKENGSSGPGTDHGVGGLAFAIGEKVKSGTFNIRGDGAGAREFGKPWRRLLAEPPNPTLVDAVGVETPFRDLLAEAMVKCIGVPITALPDALPGYPMHAERFLGYLL
ncbi:MAG: DUF1501 domain-containing protein [Planctomycetes bacterium]|nr:DUF1501 domain-containing protein [Planctomycetota bacterium]